MKYRLFALITLFGVPFSALKAVAPTPSPDIQTFGVNLLTFFEFTFIAFLFGLALLIFVFNVVRYFIFAPGNDTTRENAKRYALYSVIGMVLMASVWGIVNLFAGGLGLDRTTPVCPDFIPAERCGSFYSPPAVAPAPGAGFGGADFGADDPVIRREGEFGGTESVIEARRVAYLDSLRRVEIQVVDALLAEGRTFDDVSAQQTALMSVLRDPTGNDQNKADLLLLMRARGDISPDTYGSALQALNALRAQQGREAVFGQGQSI